MLYRIIANLAGFFDVTIEALIEDIPLFGLPQHFNSSAVSAMKPAQANQAMPSIAKPFIDKPFIAKPFIAKQAYIGREWELKQLQMLYATVVEKQTGVTGYICGMAGLGKTAMLQLFLTTLTAAGSHCIVVNAASVGGGLSPLQCLGRQLLGVAVDATAMVIRQQADKLATTPMLLIVLLWLTGVNRSPAERDTLNTLEDSEVLLILAQTLGALLDRSAGQVPLTVAIDDLHRGDNDFIQLVKALITVIRDKPVLLLLSVTNVGHFTHVPQWLDHACIIALRPLSRAESHALLETLLAESPLAQAGQQRAKQLMVERAGGHPRLLRQLLLAPQPCHSIPVALSQAVALQLNSLCSENNLGVRIASLFGLGFSAGQVHFVLLRLAKSPAVCELQSWVTIGLVKHAGAGYCFQHPLIREVIVSQIDAAERSELQSLCDAWLHSALLAK